MNATHNCQPASSYAWASRDWTKNTAIELASAVTAVAGYHPVQTYATLSLNKTPVCPNFSWTATAATMKVLYQGFVPNAIAAHQLFLMACLEKQLRSTCSEKDESLSIVKRMCIGAVAGTASGLTVTPLGAITTHKQTGQAPAQWRWPLLYRGVVPMCLRQAGLGACIFVLPAIFAEKISNQFPEAYAQNKQAATIAINLFAGGVAATATHWPEVARLLMQKDLFAAEYKTSTDAFRGALQQMGSAQGKKMFGSRLSAVTIATVGVNAAREQFGKLFLGSTAA